MSKISLARTTLGVLAAVAIALTSACGSDTPAASPVPAGENTSTDSSDRGAASHDVETLVDETDSDAMTDQDTPSQTKASVEPLDQDSARALVVSFSEAFVTNDLAVIEAALGPEGVWVALNRADYDGPGAVEYLALGHACNAECRHIPGR